MARLLDDLLDVSRVMQGKIDIRLEPCDLRKAVEAALEVVRPQIDGRDQEFLVDVESTPLIVNGDLTRLQQIQVNLLNNAMKYTPAGGKIWYSVKPEGQHVVIRVRDTGEGIPTDMLHSVFDLFVQAGGTLDRSDGGMGVGLTLVQKLVELHGGTVAAYSAGPGTGSEFVVRLPACTQAETVDRLSDGRYRTRLLRPDPGGRGQHRQPGNAQVPARTVRLPGRGRRGRSQRIGDPAEETSSTSRWSISACPAWTATRSRKRSARIPGTPASDSSP